MSTNKCVVWNFPQQSICGKISNKKLSKISTTICFVGKFTQKLFFWRIPQITPKYAFFEKFHKKLLCWKIPQKYTLLDHFHKKMQCWKTTTKKLPPSPTPAPPLLENVLKKVPRKNPKKIWLQIDPPPPLAKKIKLLYFKSHSFIRNRFLTIYYSTCFRVTILFDHFGSQNNSPKIPLNILYFLKNKY